MDPFTTVSTGFLSASFSLNLFERFSLIFSSCASKNSEVRYTGIRADEDVISSIRPEIKDKENSLLAN